MNGIKLIHSPPYHPSSNGMIERSVQTFKKSLLRSLIESKILSKQNISLQHRIDNFLFAYRTTPHSFTGQAPSELFLKCQLRTRLSSLKPNLCNSLKKKRSDIANRLVKNGRQTRCFVPGDNVLVRSVRGEEIKWFPGVIVRKLSNVTYTAQVKDQTRFVHADHLKPYFCKPESRLFTKVDAPMFVSPNDVLDKSQNVDSPKRNVATRSPKPKVSPDKYARHDEPVEQPLGNDQASKLARSEEPVQMSLSQGRAVRNKKAPDRLNL